MLTASNKTRGTTIGDRIELANTSLSRMFGLLGRKGLDVGGGLWIRPSSGVHTFFMAFSIDVIGLDANLKVIKLWHCLPPFRVTSVSMKLRSVIELPCGAIKAAGVQLGDEIELKPADSTL